MELLFSHKKTEWNFVIDTHRWNKIITVSEVSLAQERGTTRSYAECGIKINWFHVCWEYNGVTRVGQS